MLLQAAESCQRRKKKDCLDSYTIMPVTVEDLYQQLLKNLANEFRNTKWMCDTMQT